MENTVKTVRFNLEGSFDKITEKCVVCGHRNISPYKREMDECLRCYGDVCEKCMGISGLCIDCIR